MRIWEMLAATMQGENERQWKSKVNRDTYYKNIFSIEPELESFWKFHILLVQNNG